MFQSIEQILYSPIEPFNTGFLPATDNHLLYFEQCGSPNGLPIVVLHGGPGTGISKIHRRYFDPEKYKIVLIDQRGGGRSKPIGDIKNNTTTMMINDLEHLREYLQISKWAVFGTSWGTTLAAAYGISHPGRCIGFLLTGVALGGVDEGKWFTEGLRQFFPEAWHEFSEYIPSPSRADLLEAYHDRLISEDLSISLPAARSWLKYEAACNAVVDRNMYKLEGKCDVQIVAAARLEAHYYKYHAFLEEGWILANIAKIQHLPAIIVHGRFDMLAWPSAAYDLHRAWPGSTLAMVHFAGHTIRESTKAAAVVQAADRLAELVMR